MKSEEFCQENAENFIFKVYFLEKMGCLLFSSRNIKHNCPLITLHKKRLMLIHITFTKKKFI